MTQTPCGCSSSFQSGASNSGTAAFWTLIVLAVLVGLLFIGGITWCACQYNKKNKSSHCARRNAAFGDSMADEFPMNDDNMINNENNEAMLDENGNVIVQPMMMPEYAEGDGNGSNSNVLHDMADSATDAWNNTMNFLTNKTSDMDMKKFPYAEHENPQQVQRQASYYGESQDKCFDGSDWRNDGGSYAHNLNVNNLMPASWRNSEPCSSLNDTDTSQWAAFSPSKQAFDSYITSAGSARLSVNTRSALARQTGLPNLLKDMHSSPPLPLGSNAMTFNDSDLRQSLIFDATSQYPELTWC